MNVAPLIDCFKYPHMKEAYLGDLNEDTAEALEYLAEAQALTDFAVAVVADLLKRLPTEVILDEIIDTLNEGLTVNKPEMLAQIKKALEMLKTKSCEFETNLGAAEEVVEGLNDELS